MVSCSAFPLRKPADDQIRTLLVISFVIIRGPAQPDELRVPAKAHEGRAPLCRAVVVLFIVPEESVQVVGGEGQGLGSPEAEKAVASSSGGTLEGVTEVSC